MNLRAFFGEQADARAGESFPWRFVAIISIVLMELSIIIPWMQLIAVALDPPSIWVLLSWFFLFALAAHSLHRLRNRQDVPSSLLILLTLFVFLIGTLLSLNIVDGSRSVLDLTAAAQRGLNVLLNPVPIKPEIPIMIFVVLIWRRGVASASASSLEQGRTGFKFRLGVLIFFAFALISGRREISAALPTFFFSGLLAMSLTRANHVASQRTGSDPPFSVSWLLSLLGLFLITLLSGILAGRMFSTALIDQAFAALRQLVLRAFLFIYQLILPLLLIIDSAFQRWMARLAQEPQAAPDDPLSELGGAGEWFGGETPWLVQQLLDLMEKLSAYWPTIRIGLILLVVLLIFITSIRTVIRSRGNAARHKRPDEGEDVSISPSLRLRGRLNAMAQELRAWGQAAVAGQLSTAIVVRRLYSRLLSLAEAHGRSRYRWETPLEFESALSNVFPKRVAEINTLTGAYIKVRYGQLPETSDLVEQVRAAWQRIENEYR